MDAKTIIRVMVVDDHDMVRQGLAVFLATFPDFALVAEARNGTEAIAHCATTKPDVILMDLLMPGMGGLEAIRQIRSQFPQTQLLALTSSKDDDLIENAIQAGAIGYLIKDIAIDDLANAIRAAHQGQPTLAPEATQALFNIAQKPPVLGSDLTPREREVLHLMVQGLTNPQIGEQLTIGRSTVKTHVSHILQKLQVESRLEAVTYAIEHNLV